MHFFRDIVGVAEVSKEALSQRTNDHQRWVEAYARNHSIPIEWAEKGGAQAGPRPALAKSNGAA